MLFCGQHPVIIILKERDGPPRLFKKFIRGNNVIKKLLFLNEGPGIVFTTTTARLRRHRRFYHHHNNDDDDTFTFPVIFKLFGDS